MVKFEDMNVGDYVMTHLGGTDKIGKVVQLNTANKQTAVDNGVQVFWYELADLSPITISDKILIDDLKFSKEINEDGTVKYMKGAFRTLIPKENDFSRMEIWYRDETRHIKNQISLHEFQNHFHEMTKVHLDQNSFD
ncbi:MAG: hypothetical protein ABIP68_06820 [Ferruginibacter sp.]